MSVCALFFFFFFSTFLARTLFVFHPPGERVCECGGRSTRRRYDIRWWGWRRPMMRRSRRSPENFIVLCQRNSAQMLLSHSSSKQELVSIGGAHMPHTVWRFRQAVCAAVAPSRRAHSTGARESDVCLLLSQFSGSQRYCCTLLGFRNWCIRSTRDWYKYELRELQIDRFSFRIFLEQNFIFDSVDREFLFLFWKLQFDFRRPFPLDSFGLSKLKH